jgi:hypothetical protein
VVRIAGPAGAPAGAPIGAAEPGFGKKGTFQLGGVSPIPGIATLMRLALFRRRSKCGVAVSSQSAGVHSTDTRTLHPDSGPDSLVRAAELPDSSMEVDAERGSFGPVLRRLRLEAGMSQDELAERAHLSAESISAPLSGPAACALS